jgi:hypothetical protein
MEPTNAVFAVAAHTLSLVAIGLLMIAIYRIRTLELRVKALEARFPHPTIER